MDYVNSMKRQGD